MLRAFGASVTDGVSGKTTLLVVGNKPGPKKVKAATTNQVPIADIYELRRLMVGDAKSVGELKGPEIEEFSAGYRGRAAIEFSLEEREDLLEAAKVNPGFQITGKRAAELGEFMDDAPLPTRPRVG